MIDTKSFVKISPAHLAFVLSRTKWFTEKHLLHINKELLKISIGKNDRLIVNMPPRHGKSELISKYFPVWFLSVFPEKKIILTSYEYSFAASWGRKCRDIIKNNSHLLNIDIDPKNSAGDNFSLLQGGGMSCAGAGGSITGKGCDLLIIDDPVKNDAEANSKTYRDKVEEWFYSTAYTRLEPGGSIVLIMTRWHEDDLTGRILSSDKDTWKLIKLAALAEKNCPLGRVKGEALWQERFNEKRLDSIKKNLGSYWFSALYQQEPTPSGGGIFKKENFKYFIENGSYYELFDHNRTKELKSDIRNYITVDLAVSTSERSDYTVACVFAVTKENNVLIIDIERKRIEGAGHFNFVKELYEKYKPVLIGIEAVQYQLSLVQQLTNAGFPVKKLTADKDKISRALPIAAKIENGKVYFKKNSNWLGDLEAELISFPNAAHDDQTDALAYIDQMLIKKSDLLPISGRKRSDLFI
jgi:predicted phage terminase large subunit-like protein